MTGAIIGSKLIVSFIYKKNPVLNQDVSNHGIERVRAVRRVNRLEADWVSFQFKQTLETLLSAQFALLI